MMMMGAHHFPVLGVEMMRAFPVLWVEMMVLPFCSQCPSPLLVEECALPCFDEEMIIGAHSFPVLAQAQLLSLLLGEEIVGPHPAPLFDEEMMIGAHSFPVLAQAQLLSLLLGEEIVGPHPAPLFDEEMMIGAHPFPVLAQA